MEKSYEVAANWWATRIKNFKRFDNGESDKNNFLASLLATQNALNSMPSEEQLITFEKALAKLIKDELKTKNEVIVKVDYDPNELLLNAAKEAGISKTVFPWKTIVWVKDNKVTVRDGYNAKVEIIYQK